MNITDIEVPHRDSKIDKLDLIFEHQKKLKEKYDKIERGKGIFVPEKIQINDCRHQEYLKSLFYRIVSELVEASECLKNKPWKQSEVLCDVDHLFEEISDATHFLIELCICLGMSSDDFFNNYFRKMKVNEWRVETKY